MKDITGTIDLGSTAKRPIDWTNFLFLTITPAIALIAEPLYAAAYGISWPVVAVFIFYMIATGLSITAGYHRLFSHRAYKANRAVRLFFLIFGAAAAENSAAKWSADHRNHHAYTEQGDKDPYNIHKGFFYAHIWWVMTRGPRTTTTLDKVQDLLEDPLVRWQHRNYLTLAVLFGGGVPFIIGYFLGDAWGCFLLAGVTRTVLVHHSTFLINSLCHWMGKRPYSLQTARDSMFVAFLTYGEGYHNFHHTFQYDYRNGIRWYHWDPAKWLIRFLSALGWVSTLRRATDEQIFKALVSTEKEVVRTNLLKASEELRVKMEPRVQEAYHALITARARWERLKDEYQALKHSMDHKRGEIAAKMHHEIQAAREHFHRSQEAWSFLVQGYLECPA